MSKFKAILKGWSNYAAGATKPKDIRRAKICAQCPNAVKGKLLELFKDELKEVEGYKCSLCGCPLSAKIRQNEELCPEAKW